MKTSALWKRCKEWQVVDVLQDVEAGRQWMHVHGCVYPLDGMPWLDREGLLTMMDIPADKWPDWVVRVNPITEHMKEFLNDAGDDTPARMSGMSIVLHGDVLKPVYIGDEEGMVLIDAGALKPLNDTKKVNEVYVRRIRGSKLVVVKKGFELIGCIMRMSVTDKEAAETLRDVADHIIGEKKEIEARQREREGVQQSMDVYKEETHEKPAETEEE